MPLRTVSRWSADRCGAQTVELLRVEPGAAASTTCQQALERRGSRGLLQSGSWPGCRQCGSACLGQLFGQRLQHLLSACQLPHGRRLADEGQNQAASAPANTSVPWV
jgi:hypothetical protein